MPPGPVESGGPSAKRAKVDDPRKPLPSEDFLLRVCGGLLPPKTCSLLPDFGKSEKVKIILDVLDSAKRWKRKDLLDLANYEPVTAKALAVAKRYITGGTNSLTSLHVYRGCRLLIYFVGEDLFVDQPTHGAALPIFNSDFGSLLRLAYAMDPRIYDFLEAWVGITLRPGAAIMRLATVILSPSARISFADEVLKQVRSNWLQKLDLRSTSELVPKESKANFRAHMESHAPLKFSPFEKTIFGHYVPKISQKALKFDEVYKFQSLLPYVQDSVIVEAIDALGSRSGGRTGRRSAGGSGSSGGSSSEEVLVDAGALLDLRVPPVDDRERGLKKALALSQFERVREFKTTFVGYTSTDPKQVVPHFDLSTLETKFNSFLFTRCTCIECIEGWGEKGGYVSIFDAISMSTKLRSSFGLTATAAARAHLSSLTGKHIEDATHDGTGLYAEVFDVSIFNDGDSRYLTAVLPHLFGAESAVVASAKGAGEGDDDGSLVQGGLHQSKSSTGDASAPGKAAASASSATDSLPPVDSVIYKTCQTGFAKFSAAGATLGSFAQSVVHAGKEEKGNWDTLCTALSSTLVAIHKITSACFVEGGTDRVVSSTPGAISLFHSNVDKKGLLSFKVPFVSMNDKGERVLGAKNITKKDRTTCTNYKDDVEKELFLLRDWWDSVEIDEAASLPEWKE